MRFVGFIASVCIKTTLASLAMVEFALLFIADFSKYEHDAVIVFIAACMTVFCLLRTFKTNYQPSSLKHYSN